MRIAMLLATIGIALSAPADGQGVWDNEAAARKGWSMEQDRSPKWLLAQQAKMAAALASIQSQKSGQVDAYVVAIGLDGDPVFGREAAEAGRVLARRYGATGRTIVLTADSDDKPGGNPQGSPTNLATTLAAIAGKMNLKEDVLILYATTHGDPRVGLVYRDHENGLGLIAPVRLAKLLNDLGFERRMILISACYSGVFVPELATPSTVVITAASSDRPSFGCAPGNDWTFFGDALINNALRKSQPLDKAAAEAITLINQWEFSRGLDASMPQVSIGEAAQTWVAALEQKMPTTATTKVGRPAIDSDLKDAAGR